MLHLLQKLLLLTGLLLAITAAARANPETEAEPLLELLARIERQAELITSAQATFNVSIVPATPEERRRLQVFSRLQEQVYLADSYAHPELLPKGPYQATWYRKGIREREEQVPTIRPAQTTTLCFDGRQFRNLDNSPFRASMTIEPASEWLNHYHINPYFLTLEYATVSHASLIRRSGERHIAKPYESDPPGVTALTATHPSDPSLVLRFTYDDKFRLLMRESILLKSTRGFTLEHNRPAVWMRHEFYDHKPFDDGRGNTVWFPETSILRTNLGSLSDGTVVQQYAVQVDLNTLELNPDIPDEKFILEAPPGTPINMGR